ncbi:MAG: T9SS type A sorting domain-containing protein [Saprospiraceae bacterium]
MKQSFLLFCFCLFFLGNVDSQITINSNNIIAIGYVADQTTDTLPDATILEGGVGNIDWDFSALKPGDDGQFVFFHPDSTPYAASFPMANLSSRVEDGLFAYMIKNNDKIEIIGVEGTQTISGFPLEGKLTLTPGQSLIRFPATYEDEYSETVVQRGQVTGADVGFPSFDSIRLEVTVVRNVKIDAYGTMTTPSGNYDVLRSTENETSTTIVYSLNSGNWTVLSAFPADNVINFNWWTLDGEGLAYPVVQMAYNPDSGTRSVTWLKTLTDVKNLFETEATLFPNPASEYLNIDFKEPFSGQIFVYNLNGQSVISKKLENSKAERVDLQNCLTGTYLVVLRNDSGQFAGYQKIQVFK